jgi:CheY-like chemotaxis protein
VPYRRSPKGETILVVDDEAELREIARRIFTRNGYHVIVAESGPEAIEITRGHRGDIHLLVTDVVMPHMLGKEVAERIRAIKPAIEVLFISGFARRVLTTQGMLDAGVALVEKPFSEAGLMETAARVLDGHFKGFETVIGASA